MQVYFLNVWQRNYSTGPGAVKACHLWCFIRQHRPWAPEPGELQLATDALTVSEHAQDTYTFQYQVIYFFFKMGLCDSNLIDAVYFLYSRVLCTILSMISYSSLMPYLLFIPSVNCFFFNSNIPLRTMCLT